MEGSKTYFALPNSHGHAKKKILQNALKIWARALKNVREPCPNFCSTHGWRAQLRYVPWHIQRSDCFWTISSTFPINARLRSPTALYTLAYTALRLFLNHFPTTYLQLRTCSKSMTNVGKPTLTEPTHFLHIQQCSTYESQYKVCYKSSKCYLGTVMSLSSEDISYSLLCCCQGIECNRSCSLLLLL